ncbi:DUF1800 family protein [Luteolibacter sp. SL250]|uniref:DUF1800 family protein n=1 Tax=Luteolibacter sp. SL250 TaxID=2995170 RepID=UPI00226EFF26|nr:DUF1800 family protein [Luteolibacter sp. SL250]WAC21178.1 DUF1800 family protein [Luteolibacter sp. SL250]
MSVAPALALDLDANGLGDVWEARYHATGLAASDDTDGDGQSNAAESAAGTDPRDASSRHTVTITMDGTAISLTALTQPGKKYQVVSGPSPAGPWDPVGEPHIATSAGSHVFTPAAGDTQGFYRVVASDTDSDNDGVDNWSEIQLSGFDPDNGTSFPSASAGNDLAVATAMVQAWRGNALTVTATAAAAYEKENELAVITYTLPGATPYPFTIFLRTDGEADSTKSSASAADFTLRDGNDQPVTHRLVIHAGATSATLSVKPLPDALTEVPEHLNITVAGTPQSAAVSIRDAKPTLANQRLLIAYLRPLDGVDSKGSGIATVRLPGDNDVATVTVSFSNLNSPVNSTQVLNAASSILQSVQPVNYGGQQWLLRASQSFLKDQEVLDALLAGNVKLGVFTQAHVTGEIEGNFQPTSGSTEFQPPSTPGPIDPLADAELERDIARFLTQATFGPTLESINDMKARVANAGGDRIAAYSQWIDEQLGMVPPSLLTYTTAANAEEWSIRGADYSVLQINRRRGWWLLAMASKSQLKERFGFALSEIFVISENDAIVNNRAYGAANYYDMLRGAASGDFRTVLENVSRSPMMGYYLSHLRNSKATYDSGGNLLVSPDENYAREIMQLFSIGLVALHPDGSLKLDGNGSPIPTYDQTDITEMARVFTGWSFSKRNSSTSPTPVDNNTFNQNNGSSYFEAQWTNPMKVFAANHDTGAKSMIGLSLPSGQTGDQDLAAVLNHLNVHPNTAPFICRRLIQRLVTANPSAGYLYRVSEEFRTTGGNFPAVIRKILLDPEARSPQDAITLASSGKVKEPIIRATAFLRAFGAKSTMPLTDLLAFGYPEDEVDKFTAGIGRYQLNSTATTVGQSPLAAPNVFNWFLPDYSPPGVLSANGLLSPELQIANETSTVNATNFLYNGIYASGGLSTTVGYTGQTSQRIFSDFTPLEALYMAVMDTNNDGTITSLDTGAFNNTTAITNACDAVLERIDLLLCAGELKARFGNSPGKPRKIIHDAMVSIRSTSNNSNSASNQATYMRDRIKTGIWLVMSSPVCVTQK